MIHDKQNPAGSDMHNQFAWDLFSEKPLNETAFNIARARFGTNTELQDRSLYQAIVVYMRAITTS
jgi:hypothetical protein